MNSAPSHLEPNANPSLPQSKGVDETQRQGRGRILVSLGALAVAIAAGVLAVRLLNRPEVEAPVASPPSVRVDKGGVTLTEGAPQWEYVKLAVAEEGPGLPPLPAPARVGFDEKRTASIGAPLGGRIEQLQVRMGDTVKAGDKLFSVRSRDFAELDREAATAREAVLVKRRLHERAKELFELNAVPEKEVFAAEAELKEAQLSQKAAEAKRRSLSIVAAGDNLFWVRAPRAGTIVSLDVFANQEVTPDRDEPLARISDMDEVLVVADVPELDATDLALGSVANIRTRDGLERTGTIHYIAPVVDAQRQTLSVRVRAANTDHALKPNAFVEVTFSARQEKRSVLVAEDAVVTDGDQSTVFVLTDSQRFDKRSVQPGRRRNGLVEIRSGLEAGTRYAAKGALLLLNQVELAD